VLIVGFVTWKFLIEKPDYLRPSHSYYNCPDGTQHGPGVPAGGVQGIQEWCEKYGFVISENDEYKNGEVITISGYIISGGDTTPKGLLDTPRRFVYSVQKDDGTNINVQYMAYPPSPKGDLENKKVRIVSYSGKIKIGDYMKASGTYDKKRNLLIVANEGDYIETYSQKQ